LSEFQIVLTNKLSFKRLYSTDIKHQVLNLLEMSKKDPPSRSESQDVANKQEFVEGQRKEIDVKDYAEVQSLGQILKDLKFPATKNQIVTFVERHNSNNELISKLKDIQEKEYVNVFEVAKASGIAR
jgi:Protein of unknown function (DUF2795)